MHGNSNMVLCVRSVCWSCCSRKALLWLAIQFHSEPEKQFALYRKTKARNHVALESRLRTLCFGKKAALVKSNQGTHKKRRQDGARHFTWDHIGITCDVSRFVYVLFHLSEVWDIWCGRLCIAIIILCFQIKKMTASISRSNVLSNFTSN